MKDSETHVSHKCFISFQWALELKSPSPTSTLPSHSSQGSVCKEGSCHSVDLRGLSNVCKGKPFLKAGWSRWGKCQSFEGSALPSANCWIWVLLHWLKSEEIEEISYKQLTSLCNEEICGTLHVPRKQTNKKTKSKVDYVNAMQQLDGRLKNLVCSGTLGTLHLRLPSSVLNCTLMVCLYDRCWVQSSCTSTAHLAHLR